MKTEYRIAILVHLDSTTVYVLEVKIDNKAATTLLKANGVFLYIYFTKEPVCVYIEVYVPKE